MNPSDPLEQLRDIHLPDPVSWWPPAPGWWILLVAGTLAVIFLAWFGLRKWRARAYRRIARRELEAVYAQWQEDSDNRACLESINAILKRAALRSFPADRVAALSGENWRSFLDTQLPGKSAEGSGSGILAESYYSPVDPGEEDLRALHSYARHWLHNHRSNPC